MLAAVSAARQQCAVRHRRHGNSSRLFSYVDVRDAHAALKEAQKPLFVTPKNARLSQTLTCLVPRGAEMCLLQPAARRLRCVH